MQEQRFVPSRTERLPRRILVAPIKKQPTLVLAFVNQKGGGGKTTIAQNLAVCLGLRHRKRVLLIDLDPQGNLGQGLIHGQINNSKTADRLLVVPKVDVNEYIIQVRPNVDLIHNNYQKEIRESVDRLPPNTDLLRKQLGMVLAQYDYVFIDTPAGLCRSTQIGVDAADHVILVASCGGYELQGVIAAVNWIAGDHNRLARRMPSIKVMLNNYDGRQQFDREFASEARRIFGDDVFQTHIHTSAKIVEAAAMGVAVIEYDNSCCAAEDFEWLSQEFLGLFGAEDRRHAV